MSVSCAFTQLCHVNGLNALYVNLSEKFINVLPSAPRWLDVSDEERYTTLKTLSFLTKRVLFRVGCQAGTYIRKLCFDIGAALGSGAHMEELRRTRTGPFTEDANLATLYDLYEAYNLWVEAKDESLLRKLVQPMENALGFVPKVFVRDSAIDSICHGANLAVPGIAKLEAGIRKKGVVGLFTLKGEIIALARALMTTDEMVHKERGLATNTMRVIMAPETYPRIWRKRSGNVQRNHEE